MGTATNNKYILVILSGKKLTFGSNSLISEAEDAGSSPTHSLIFNLVQSEAITGSVFNFSSVCLIPIELD